MSNIFQMLSVAMLIFLSGCGSTGTDKKQDYLQPESMEKLFIETQNYSQLINLYKSELLKKDSVEMRLKLIDSYLQLGDADSALFYLATVSKDEKNRSSYYFMTAQAEYQRGNFSVAEQALSRVLDIDADNSEAINLRGILLVELGETAQARENFNRARLYFIDDIVIKNNLAVLDMLEGDYQRAVNRLAPIYQKGQADEQVEANLVIAYARLEEFEQVKRLLISKMSVQEIMRVYQNLKKQTLQPENDLQAGS
ncbi:MAG: tetratricopeptide repeat protein [Pseudomonadales bacterium]|nr:tetratricopeptide repeat protein [Pseudomonadales bacterium]